MHTPSPFAKPLERDAAIRRILDARFSFAALEALRDADPQAWHSARNAMGRGIYGEALRESWRLSQIPDVELEAELAQAALHEAQLRFD